MMTKPIHHCDVEQAFIQSGLKEVAYKRLPQSIGQNVRSIARGYETFYGIRQIARESFSQVGINLRLRGFKQSLADPYLYRLMDEDKVVILLMVHVDKASDS